MFKVNNIFLSMQGEGIDTGLPTIFVRLSGCKMGCPFCDEKQNFGKHKLMWEEEIIERISMFSETYSVKNVVFTGGEPLEHDLGILSQKLVYKDYRLGIETNGSIPLGDLKFYFKSISVSPKIPFEECKIDKCTSLKVLFPYYNGALASEYKKMEARYYSLQPIWGEPDAKGIFDEVMKLGYPWRLGPQVHKLLGMV